MVPFRVTHWGTHPNCSPPSGFWVMVTRAVVAVALFASRAGHDSVSESPLAPRLATRKRFMSEPQRTGTFLSQMALQEQYLQKWPACRLPTSAGIATSLSRSAGRK